MSGPVSGAGRGRGGTEAGPTGRAGRRGQRGGLIGASVRRSFGSLRLPSGSLLFDEHRKRESRGGRAAGRGVAWRAAVWC